ncbi:hydroxymethylglutaryl-CoA lyase [Roseibium aggregatum]|uniref:Hydroxymethylglutaryl-CoA lyase n=1 Tax=Roseibium aggregatum TaxID=187304 RepID=A0A939EFC0_9HYPH|nr:hydroxymethylglutaryl-CoA lyase [Roseibium aggregatum]MBN9670524.1 hydroxymethylglutaryl-CoA lyase [Roseibium aggregatum]
MRADRLFPKDRIVLREVGLRDGLQLTKQYPTTKQKHDWLLREHAAGVRHFEVGSFLPASRFPQFADLRELIELVGALDGACSTALTLNERGVADALETEVDEIMFVLSATESHSLANTRRSRAEALRMLERINLQRLNGRGRPPVLTVGIAMAFGCSLEGEVAPKEVIRLAEACKAAGVDTIAVADTVGFGGPAQVGHMAHELRRLLGDDQPISMHFHDTRGLAIANCAAALDNGIRILDGSLGGLGGCPFAPGATGNTVFEDMVFLCDTMGLETGIDVTALAEVRAVLRTALPDEPLHGAVARAGVPKVLEVT